MYIEYCLWKKPHRALKLGEKKIAFFYESFFTYIQAKTLKVPDF